MAPVVENWDDDADFQGDLFSASQSTAPPSISSRLSVRSESVAGDEEWQVLVPPNDNAAHARAISSAKQVGIPIPQNIPASALLGGTIKKLGKKQSKRNIAHDDWDDDLEIPDSFAPKLVVKKDVSMLDAPRSPVTPANIQDEFDTDWAEGSLGIRFGGTRRDQRGRSSSVSAMSPSMGSCMTLESEDDDFGGLVLPEEPIDFSDRLRKRKEAEVEPPTPELGDGQEIKSSKPEQPSLKKLKIEDDDLLSGLDIGNAELTDKRKRKIHPAIKINDSKLHPSPPRMATTTLTFTDKPTISRIPRPTTSSKLDPVYESMASHINPRSNRLPPTTTGAQLLRSKRSAPALTTRQKLEQNTRPPVPFLPPGIRNIPQPVSRPPGHGRHLSDHDRPATESFRSVSRASGSGSQQSPEVNTPSRAGFRRDVAPAALARQAANQRTLQVTKRRNFGDGSELERFDDLPTSATKEQKFMKEPTNRAPTRTLRHITSKPRLALDRNNTPQPQQSYPSSVASTVPSTPLAPPTPRSGYFTGRPDTTPRFARDTAASRNAREQRLGINPSRPRDTGPLNPVSINWKAQVAARNPQNSPTAQRRKPGEVKKPYLIKQMSHSHLVKNENGMTYNPTLHRWEGNDHALAAFSNPSLTSLRLQKEGNSHHHHTDSTPSNPPLAGNTQPRQGSPPRPALITPMAGGHSGIRVERGMVFDPQQMRWLKIDPKSLNDPTALLSPGSVSIEEDDDPFAGLEDLKDDKNIVEPGTGGENKENMPAANDAWAIGEEFDVGPSFIKRQRLEEVEWQRRVERWMSGRDPTDEKWKWEVKEVARDYEGHSSNYR